MKTIDVLRAEWTQNGPAHGLLKGVKINLSLEGEGQSARLLVEMSFPDGSSRQATLPIQRNVYSSEGENTFWWEEDLARELRFAEGYKIRLAQLEQRLIDADAEIAARRSVVEVELADLRREEEEALAERLQEFDSALAIKKAAVDSEIAALDSALATKKAAVDEEIAALDAALAERREVAEVASVDVDVVE